MSLQDQEKALWLSNLMKSMKDPYHDDMPVMFGSADAVNAIDIIQQIGRVDVPKVKCFLGRCVQLIKDKEGHPDESSA